MEHTLVCTRCKRSFVSKRSARKFCSKTCSFASRHHNDVVKRCEVCNVDFVVAYRFRAVKTCGPKCNAERISRSLTKRITKQCHACGNDFEVVPSYEASAKYCSYDCFLNTRDTRQPNVEKTCVHCKQLFVVPYTKREQQFCSRGCAKSGVNSPWYGKVGPMKGKQAWNRGLTAKTDKRLADLGAKVSDTLGTKFRNGELSHAGAANPNYGHTSDKLTSQQRSNYSRAAVNRVLSGVSGYKTGHLTGVHESPKSQSPVRFKSSWELATMMWWDRQRNVVSYAYEPRVFELADGRRAIPDFFVAFSDGTTTYVEIKPTAIQKLPVVAQRLAMTSACVAQEGHSYVTMGNQEIDSFKRELGKEFQDAVERHQGGS